MPTEYTLEIAGTEYPWVDLRYVRDYKFYGKLIEAIIPEWVAAIAGDDAITIKRDGAVVTSGKIKQIAPFEGIGKGMGMILTGYTKEQKHATLLVNARTYNADPHAIIIDDLGSSDLTDGTTNAYGSNIVVEFGSNDESKFSRREVYEEVVFITGWELYVNPSGVLDFKSQCGVNRSSTVEFKHGELLQCWYKPDMLNYLVRKTKVIVLGALEAEFEFYGIAGTGTDVYTIERKNLIDDNTCALAAAAVYADMQNTLRSGVMDVIDTYSGAAYDVYDTIHVVDPRFDLDQNVRIYRIERHIDKNGEHTRIFYTNITKLTCNGRYLLDLGNEELDAGQRVIRDFGKIVVNVIDKDALNAGGSVDFSKVGVVNKNHTYLGGISSGQHHGMSHKSRHVTVGGADPLDTASDGSHQHDLPSTYQSEVLVGYTMTPKWAHDSSDPESGLSIIYGITQITKQTSAYLLTSDEAVSGGAHVHDVTTSPTPDREDAEEGEELIVFVDDMILGDGRRGVTIFYPEFDLLRSVTHPAGSTNERIIKDAKYHYHRLWTLQKENRLPAEPKPGAFKGKRLKWDRDKEEAHMAAELAKTGEEEREENERKLKERMK